MSYKIPTWHNAFSTLPSHVYHSLEKERWSLEYGIWKFSGNIRFGVSSAQKGFFLQYVCTMSLESAGQKSNLSIFTESSNTYQLIVAGAWKGFLKSFKINPILTKTLIEIICLILNQKGFWGYSEYMCLAVVSQLLNLFWTNSQQICCI